MDRQIKALCIVRVLIASFLCIAELVCIDMKDVWSI